jgi:Rrf2 family protein
VILLVAGKVQRGQFDFVPAQRISEVLGLSPASVAAILRRLHHAGLIETREGANGGVRLAKPPQQITVLDIFKAIEQDRPLFQPTGESRISDERVTTFYDTVSNVLKDKEQAMKGSLQATTLQELLDKLS